MYIKRSCEELPYGAITMRRHENDNMYGHDGRRIAGQQYGDWSNVVPAHEPDHQCRWHGAVSRRDQRTGVLSVWVAYGVIVVDEYGYGDKPRSLAFKDVHVAHIVEKMGLRLYDMAYTEPLKVSDPIVLADIPVAG